MDHPIFAGLVHAAAIAFIATCAKWVWTGAILPRWRAAQVDSRNLDKTSWELFRDGKRLGILKLTQTGERLAGQVDFENDERKFRYFGIIRGDQIRMEWAERGLAKLNFGSLNLKVAANAKTLTGYTTFVHRDEGKVVSRACEFRKLTPAPAD